MQRRIDEETIPGGRGERGQLAYSFLNHVCYTDGERLLFFFFSSRRRHTRCSRDWSSDVCSSDLVILLTFNGQPRVVQMRAHMQRVFKQAHVFIERAKEGFNLSGNVNGTSHPIDRKSVV